MICKTVLITGATGGIGEELCREFARRGYELFITARDEQKLQQQAKRLHRAYGAVVHVIAEDLRDPQTPLRIYNRLGSSGTVIDVLVNNAGFGAGGLFVHNRRALQEEMVQVNCLAPTHMCRLFLPDMLARRSGHIVNIASTGSLVPGPNNAVYCASKAYLLSLSEALSQETRGTGVFVTAVCPGATHTGFAHRARMESTALFRFLVMEPRQVAQEAYRAMCQRKKVHVVGFPNKVMAASVRFAPRALSAAVSGAMQRQGIREK